MNKTLKLPLWHRLFSSLNRVIVIGLISTSAIAETEEPTPWFEIEIIVFKPTDKLNLNDESWDKDAKFSLANSASIDPTSSNKKQSNPPLIDFVQPLPQLTSPCEQPCDETSNSMVSSEDSSINQRGTNNENVNRGDPSVIDIESLDEEAALLSKLNQLVEETPFTPLDSKHFQLNQESANLMRHPDYQLLTHLMWRQPVLPKSQAPSIRIAGGFDFSQSYDYAGDKLTLDSELTDGKSFNTSFNSDLENQAQSISQNLSKAQDEGVKHTALNEQGLLPVVWVPELDGDIKIYLNRFLHIKTNLVLRRADKELIEAIDLDIYDPEQLTSFNQSAINANSFNQTPTDQKPNTQSQSFVLNNPFESKSNTQSTINNQSTENSTETSVFFSQDSNNERSQFSWEIDDNFLNTESEQLFIERLFNYPVQHSRKVKSNQLHYFDHPLMGVLIMIRPYERPTELSQQTAEQVNP